MDIAGLHIEVQEIKDRRIEWAIVSKIDLPEPEEEKKEKGGKEKKAEHLRSAE